MIDVTISFRLVLALAIIPILLWLYVVFKLHTKNSAGWLVLYFLLYIFLFNSSETLLTLTSRSPTEVQVRNIYAFIYFLSVAATIVSLFHSIYSMSVSAAKRDNIAPSELNSAEADTIDINTASVDELASFPEIGSVRAKKIAQRTEQGNYFKSFDELAAFIGLSEFERERLQDRVVFSFSVEKGAAKKPPKGRIIDY